MNLKNYPRPVFTITQYCQPHCTELKGSSFKFVMDTGYDFLLTVTGDDTCEWNLAGDAPKTAHYGCRKADDTTYLFDFELEGVEPRENYAFVIDLEQYLVTWVHCRIGDNPRLPLLISSSYSFGYIEQEGREPGLRRHSFTGELMGTTVEWHWRTGMFTQHSYYSPVFYRITWPAESDADFTIGDWLPSSDDVTRYIKIKDKMFLFCLTEEMLERSMQGFCPFRSNNMLFLQNYDRMYHVGRTFGTFGFGNDTAPRRTFFGAFGNPVHFENNFLTAENPYTV